ncbi:hypothetical protein [Micromonospora chersina]
MLRRDLPPARKQAIKRVMLSRRYKATGPDRDVVELVLDRAQYSCELRGCMVGDRRGVDWSIHHRLPRRMGGTKRPEVNQPQSLLVVCGSGTTGCHGWLEARRTEAYDLGLLLHAGDNPSEVPVGLAVGLVWLSPDGRYLHEAPEVA